MEKINEKKLTLKSIGYIIFYLFILSSAYYFILKYSTKIPFFLSPIVHFFGYIPSLKNENKRGASLGAGFIFFREQNTFAILIDKLFKIIN